MNWYAGEKTKILNSEENQIIIIIRWMLSKWASKIVVDHRVGHHCVYPVSVMSINKHKNQIYMLLWCYPCISVSFNPNLFPLFVIGNERSATSP